MKKHIKKLISSLIAISLAAPIFSGIPVFAENSDGTIVEQTQALTVVGKRIKGDDTYFEISLEVNDDYDKYSSVGVVLRYDPDYIIPAESWDEGAGAADMSENTTWATRRALPTLGLETWSTHTALAYQEDTAATGSGGKKYGYLYLGAEHPLTVEGTSDSSASSDSSDSSESDPAAPAAEPEASPEPGTRPVVVARFMYKTDETVSGKTTKDSLVDAWINGTNNSGAVQSKGTNWDYDWTANTILTIASDEVAGKSPAQYPFAIYTQDYEEKAFMRTWPTVTTTVPPAPGDPTPTPMPISAYAPEIGAGVDPANHLTRNDIMIITCEGESAKATGGLKLSDIFVILFYDWDDSLLGTLTTGVGVDATEAVNNYVEAKFIHPDLRTTAASPPDYTALAATGVEDWKKRQYSYRGEYPCESPGSGATFPDGAADAGSTYLLTNKLDYTFAGKDINPDMPFANGWTQVVPKSIQYNPTDFPSTDMLNAQPKALEDTWTALSKLETFSRVEFDSAGVIIDPSTGAGDPSATLPTLISFDFSKITSDMLKNSDGNLYVKAVYEPGDLLNGGSIGDTYSTVGPAKYNVLGSVTTNDTVLSIKYQLKRVNDEGYGVTRIKSPAIKMGLKVNGSSETYLGVNLNNDETMDVELTPSQQVSSVTYQLRDIKGATVITGNERSKANALGTFMGAGDSGFLRMGLCQYIVDMAYDINTGARVVTSSENWLTANTLKAVPLYRTATGTAYTNATFAKKAQDPVLKFVATATAMNGGEKPTGITRYQLQYAILNSGAYKSAADAETAYVGNAKIYGI